MNAAGGKVYECGATGNCMFDSFGEGAIRTGDPALVSAVSRPELASPSLSQGHLWLSAAGARSDLRRTAC